MISFPEITQDVTELVRHFNQNTMLAGKKDRWIGAKKGKSDPEIGDRILTGQSPLFSVILMFLSPDLKAIQFVVFSSLRFSLSPRFVAAEI